MHPLLHWGNQGIIRGFHVLDPLGSLALITGFWAASLQRQKQSKNDDGSHENQDVHSHNQGKKKLSNPKP